MAKNLITRQQYKNIKKMDHVQMSDFFTRVWQDGFNDGIKAGKKNRAAAVKPGDIEKAIANSESLFRERGNSNGAKDYANLVGEILTEINNE